MNLPGANLKIEIVLPIPRRSRLLPSRLGFGRSNRGTPRARPPRNTKHTHQDNSSMEQQVHSLLRISSFTQVQRALQPLGCSCAPACKLGNAPSLVQRSPILWYFQIANHDGTSDTTFENRRASLSP